MVHIEGPWHCRYPGDSRRAPWESLGHVTKLNLNDEVAHASANES